MSAVSYIARRYLFSHRKISLVGVITGVAVTGVAVSIFAMFVVLSVFSGLRKINEASMGTIYPDIEISPSHGKTFMADDAFLGKIRSIPQVENLSLTITEKAFLKYRSHEVISRIKGVDENYMQVVDMSSVITGEANMGTDSVYARGDALVGIKTAYVMQMRIPDYEHPLSVYVPSAVNNRAFSSFYRKVELNPTAYFTGHGNEENMVYMPIDILRELTGKSHGETGAVEIRLSPSADEDAVARKIRNAIGEENYTVKTSAQMKAMMYKIINTENMVLYFVFALIVIIALFNVAGAIVMLIIEKKENIFTLRSLGMNGRSIRRIFMMEGMMSVWAGALAGLACGITLVWLQQRYSLITIEGGVNMAYPVELNFGNILTVICTIALLGYVAALISTAGMKNIINGTHHDKD